jgi:hypothetical protein
MLARGLKATGVVGSLKNAAEVKCPADVPVGPISCTFACTVNPYERLMITLKLKVGQPIGMVAKLANEVIVEGGVGPRATVHTVHCGRRSDAVRYRRSVSKATN